MNALLAAIAALVTYAVAAFGGTGPSGQAVLETGSALLLLLWALRVWRGRIVEIRTTVLFAPVIGLGGIAAAQLWWGQTASAYATKIELLKWTADFLLVFLFVQSCRTKEQIRRFVWFLAGLGFAVALFGLVQQFTWSGKLYWSIALPPTASAFGPFVNRDHFAGFVELTVPLPLAILVHGACEREKRLLLALFAIVPIGALFVCASRGGIMSFLFGCAILLALTGGRRFGASQRLVIASLLAAAIAFAGWLGVHGALQRFGDLEGGGISRDRRVSMYRDTWHVFEQNLWTGTGLGTLVVVYPQFESYYDGLIVDHAHNDYLELLADTGIAGGICGLAFILVLARRGPVRWAESEDTFVRAARAGALAACASILLHSLVDFNLHIPSNGLLFLLLATLATSSLDKAGDGRKRITTETAAVPF
jgi:O-antigen ligase